MDSIPGVVQPPKIPDAKRRVSEPNSLTMQTSAAFGLLAWAHFFDAWIFNTMGWTTAAAISAGLVLSSIALGVAAFAKPSLIISAIGLFWAVGLALYVVPTMLTAPLAVSQIIGAVIRLGTIMLAFNGVRATIR